LLLLVGVPLAAFAGKTSGGFLADRIGWIEATSLALLVSTPLIVWGGAHPPLLLLGMLVFQTTMPVTLIAVARALPRFPGVAFGLPCLALVLGSLPALYPGAAPFLLRSQLLGWAALALASVTTGLWLLGLRPAQVLPFPNRKRITT
jgi:FSR family fosmidomycin resistance protein-like MFS transporter